MSSIEATDGWVAKWSASSQMTSMQHGCVVVVICDAMNSLILTDHRLTPTLQDAWTRT